jgi:hypothetical protein
MTGIPYVRHQSIKKAAVGWMSALHDVNKKYTHCFKILCERKVQFGGHKSITLFLVPFEKCMKNMRYAMSGPKTELELVELGD